MMLSRKSPPSALPRIARRPVASSMMRSAGYDESHAVLEIEFVTGHVYRYHAVPRRDWIGLMEAGQRGVISTPRSATNIRCGAWSEI